MSFKENVAYMINDLRGKGVHPSDAAPPLWRFFWYLGFETTPPLFMNSFKYGLIWAAYFGPAMSLFVYLLLGFGEAIVFFLPASLVSGLVMGVRQHLKRRKLQLPFWPEYLASHNR